MPDKKPFIKENIVKKSSMGRGFRRLIITVASGIIIGLIAVVTMVLAGPSIQNILAPTEETTAEVVIIPKDELMDMTEPRPAEPEPEEEKFKEPPEKPEEETEEEEPIEDIVEKAIEEHEYSVDDFNSLWGTLDAMCQELDPSLVTVKTISSSTDWFNNEISKEGAYSGIFITATSDARLILTPIEAVQNRQDITVVWNNGIESEAEVRGSDTVSGLAVLSVSEESLDEETREYANPVTLGNSYNVKRGDVLIAVGCPQNIPHSTTYTWASYIGKNINTVDGTARFIYTTDKFETDKGTWMVNSGGELIGWASSVYNSDENAPDTIVIGLSEYKVLLERMSNSEEYAYFGLTATEVSESMKEGGAPTGIYVAEVEAGSPAYNAGIQPGDIVEKINNNPIISVADYVKALENLEVESEALVSVKRRTMNEFASIDYKLTVGKRSQ